MTREQLQQRLQEQHDAVTRLQALAHAQQVRANLLTTSLRAKLRRREQELKMIKSDHEQQISAVLSHLLYLEGHMQKEQNEILEVLQDKDDIIRRQKAAIQDLTVKNDRYLQALKESHGYSTDNGLVKPLNYIVQENGNVSIQDHGNKVILRSNKTRNGEKVQGSGHKVRFSAMKDKLRRHQSSLELYQHESLETLVEGTLRYGSEENLVGDRSRASRLHERKEKSRSLIDYPVSLFDVDEGHSESPDSCFDDGFPTPTISRNDSTTSLVIPGEKSGRSSFSSAFGFNELSKSRSVPHALPTVSENDASPTNLKGRPHSLPSVEMLAKDLVQTATAATTATTTAAAAAASTPTSKVSTPPNTASSSPPSESNPFKSIKNVFKRKGSKKKRAAAVASGKEQSDALKQHFKKYDMT